MERRNDSQRHIIERDKKYCENSEMSKAVDTSELDRIYELILQLIKNAGALAMDGFNSTDKCVDTKQGSWDLVTRYDKAVEDLIIAGIRKNYPDHRWVHESYGLHQYWVRNGTFRILGEESTSNLILTDDPTWIIDPIDGTTNYVHKIPIFGITVAFCVKKETLIGVTLNPAGNELYTARKGHGAYLNGKRIQCSNVTQVMQLHIPQIRDFVWTKVRRHF